MASPGMDPNYEPMTSGWSSLNMAYFISSILWIFLFPIDYYFTFEPKCLVLDFLETILGRSFTWDFGFPFRLLLRQLLSLFSSPVYNMILLYPFLISAPSDHEG